MKGFVSENTMLLFGKMFSYLSLSIPMIGSTGRITSSQPFFSYFALNIYILKHNCFLIFFLDNKSKIQIISVALFEKIVKKSKFKLLMKAFSESFSE